MTGQPDSGASSQLVSVVIATRDRAALLPAAVDAMRAQSYPALEIIVVDDGSVDATPGVVAEMDGGIPPVRFLKLAEPGGAGAARNAGARVARGAYLLFEDDDCRGRPERVARLVRALEQRPEAAYAYCWIERPAGDSTAITGTEGAWSIGTPFALVRRHVFEAVGGFDEALPRLVDFDLWTRILARWPAVEVPEVLFETVLDGVGISASDDRLVAAARQIMDKYREIELPAPHLSRMHRMLGGALLLKGRRREGLAHFRRAVSVRKREVRSWLGLAAAGAGPRVYRLLARAQGRVRWRAARGRAASARASGSREAR